nr:unnamed protein product [Callosobruchus chinensis]
MDDNARPYRTRAFQQALEGQDNACPQTPKIHHTVNMKAIVLRWGPVGGRRTMEDAAKKSELRHGYSYNVEYADMVAVRW